ncbi:MAG: hypothetical protein OK457_02660 [Thaumarchaeota archaeon]|nr:hypothetical protein [Nitrososphaerota archaeon]
MATVSLSSLRTATSPGILLPIYSIGVVGAFLQVVGAQWDVSWHILGIVETFFTQAHAVLYTGIALVAIANLLGLIVNQKLRYNPVYSKLFTGLRIAIIGSTLQLIAAPFDFWWHSTYGFDPFLFTPAHSLLIVGFFLGGLGMTLGVTRLHLAQKSGLKIMSSTRFLDGMVVLALAAFWGGLLFFTYYLTDTAGMAYTLNLCFIQQFRTLGILSCQFVNEVRLPFSLVQLALFAGSGTLVFWISKRVFGERRGFLTVATAILMAVYLGASIGFTSYALQFLRPPGSFYGNNPTPADGVALLSTIPIYLFFLIPVALLDLGITSWPSKWKFIFLSARVGLFASFIDGRFTSGTVADAISGGYWGELLIIAFTTLIGGAVAGALVRRTLSRSAAEIGGLIKR